MYNLNLVIMKKYFYLATALVALAACTSNDFTGDQEALGASGQTPISFSSSAPAMTRASGAEAATVLSNQFIVYGEKGEAVDGAGTTPAAGNLVFPNYWVKYTANTAYKTTSNTENWEYVGSGYTADDAAKIKMNGTAVTTNEQTIKYWDYGASNYVLTAVSALPADITNGRVVIDKITTGTTKYGKGYTITLAKTGSEPYTYPDLSKLYFADRQVISQTSGKDRTASNQYGGNVTFTFRNSLSQVRAGIYETNPGYDVSAIKFYVSGDAEAKVSSTSAFGVIAPNTKASKYEGTLTVTYYDNSVAAIENHPKLSFSGSPAADLILGTNTSTLSTSNLMGKTSTAPTWDTSGGDYTSVLPQITNATDMTLKVDYTLYNAVTGETTNITGKTAVVPAAYLQWKPNYKYTYLFKITDSDLYPITFDAVVVEAEDGQAEYITTITQPSITTFGVKDSKYVVSNNEYVTGSDIYATILVGTTTQTPTIGTNVNIYYVTGTGITEASVAEAIAEISAQTHAVTVTKINSDATTYFTAVPSAVTSVPTEDGNTVAKNAVKLTGVKAAGTYAIEFEKTARTYKNVAVTFATSEAFTAAKAALNLYTDSSCETPVTGETTWGGAETNYYKKVVDNVGEYAYKVIKVQ